MTEARQSRMHRGHRIVAVQLGEARSGIVHSPDGDIVGHVDGQASAQEVTVRGMGLVDGRLKNAPTG